MSEMNFEPFNVYVSAKILGVICFPLDVRCFPSEKFPESVVRWLSLDETSHFVYEIRNDSDETYVGMSADPQNRISTHIKNRRVDLGHWDIVIWKLSDYQDAHVLESLRILQVGNANMQYSNDFERIRKNKIHVQFWNTWHLRRMKNNGYQSKQGQPD